MSQKKKAPERKTNADNKKELNPYLYIGERIEYLRKFLGITRKEMAALLKITNVQYGLLESKVSSTIPRFNAILQFFAVKHNINPTWIILEDNSKISLHLTVKKDLATLITELNELLKDQGLMVSMVPKV